MENKDGISLACKGFEGDHLKKIIATKFKLGKIVPQGDTFENCLFMKKENLAHETILLNVVDFLLHHITHVESTKDGCWQEMATTSKVLQS
jgi:hypothetical protein